MAWVEVKAVYKVVKYAATPLFILAALAALIVLLLYKSKTIELPSYSIILLNVLLAGIVITIILLLIFDPKRLQFTAEEQIMLKPIELSDSKMLTAYLPGQIPSLPKPLTPEPEGEEEK